MKTKKKTSASAGKKTRRSTTADLTPKKNVKGGASDPIEFIVVGSGAGGGPLAAVKPRPRP